MTLGEGFAIRRLDVDEARAAVPGLADVLIDCVAGGASVSFMAPLELDKAVAFWNGVVEAVGRGERALLVAEAVGKGRIVGTVQVVLNQPENQPHRADISKLLVHRGARGQGIAVALMDAAEEAARAAGKTLLVLDTATGGDAERLYARLGWTVVGRVPDYALWPDGRPCDTTFHYKRIAG